MRKIPHDWWVAGIMALVAALALTLVIEVGKLLWHALDVFPQTLGRWAGEASKSFREASK